MARHNGRSYVVKGETPKRYWEPSQGDVVYIEGTRTRLGKPYQEPGDRDIMFPLRPSVRGTTDMSARNIKAIARVEEGKGLESVGSTATFSRRPNPDKYRVISSFGGTVVGWHNTLAAARKNAAAQSFQGPLDIWETKGGQFGHGKVVAHYVDGKAASVKRNPTAVPLHYFVLNLYRSPSDRGKVSPQTLTRLLRSVAVAKTWARGEVTKHGGVGYLYKDTKPVATIHYEPPYIPRQNPGPSAIPAQWTPATVSRHGGQIQIRMGGKRS